MATYKNMFRVSHNGILPVAGSQLIAEPFLQDAYFQRSVVLLVEHSPKGSMGFVWNKKTDLVVNSYFAEFEHLPDMPIYLGGPVQTNKLFYVHTLGEEILPGSYPINDHLFFDGDFESLKYYIMNGHPVEGRIRFFLGYSGWAAGQLGQEIKQDSWAVSRQEVTLDPLSEGESYWKQVVGTLGQDYRTWCFYPKDPMFN